MNEDRLQMQRLELKYQVSDDVALAARDFISSYLELDEFGATRPNLSYPVHSLYLDSPGLATYHHTINGNKNRFKLRVRFYENRPSAPVYFEIKRRMNNAILKQRGAVHRDAVDRLVAGQLPAPAELATADPRHLAGLQAFVTRMIELRARPVAHVAYQREAWMSPRDNSVRVTLDRDVLFEPEPVARLETRMADPLRVFGHRVILELKFTGRFPDWWQELVRVFNLRQSSAAKYADGVARYGEDRLKAALRGEAWGWAAPVSDPELPANRPLPVSP
ncbi:MAG: polyphosphate polymerase domain-containing protein [Verrucomicrobiae bacterium]|nr:polyphosphate polymerase domain-containing protein [Verrucomicrobiae bacterium]